VSTYADIAGIAIVAEGLSGTPNINVGIVTASSYEGSGVNLTGIITTLVAGSNVTITQSSGIATISGSVSAGYANSAGIATVAQGLTGTPNISVNQVAISSFFSVTGVTSFYNDVNFEYNKVLSVGNNDELQLFHNGSNSYIRNASANNFIIRSTGGSILLEKEGPELMGVFNTDGSVELYYNNSKKFETLSIGATISGSLFASELVIANEFIGNQLKTTGIITASSFSGSGAMQSRTIVSGVTTSIVNNGIGNTNITGFKSYALMKVGLSTAGWLRLYTDSASRTADASRSQGINPSPGSGVIAEVITTGISTTQIITPFVMGGNLDDPSSTTIYAAITNLSGSTQAITANLTILQLEV